MSLTKKLVWLPYDFDTAIGINNEGELVFDYSLEDIDTQPGGADIFNGQQSVVWKNVRAAFADELKVMYQTLRSSGGLAYAVVEQMFETHQGKWPEAIFNEDAWFKYIEPFVQDGTDYLGMLQGSKAEQRKWWLYNRFRYIDSKYVAGDALTDTIMLRPYGVDDISVTPYADIYATVAWDAHLTQVRAARGTTVTLECPYSSMNDNVVTIYSASQLASVGDLSGLMIGLGNFANATRLQSLKIGDSASGYDNTSLRSLTLGNNVLLQTIDVRNCSGLGDTSMQGHTQTTVDLSGCSILENVYFDGTKVTGVTLPNGGVLKVLHLPATITNLTIMNQPSITDLTVASYANISTLRIENCPTVNTKAILNAIPASSRVRLIGFYWEAADAAEIEDLLDVLDTMRGLDESGGNVETAQVSGTIHTASLTGAQIASYNARYPYLTVTADHVTSYLTCKTWDGATIISTITCIDGVAQSALPSVPSRTSTAQYDFTAVGWNTEMDAQTADPDAAVDVIADRTIYAAYSRTVRTYTATFVRASADGGGTLYTQTNIPYGTTPTYGGATPTTTQGSAPDYTFNGWNPELAGITGDTTYTAVFKDNTSKTRKLIQRTITNASSEIVTNIGGYAFYGCTNLTVVDFPVATSIGSYAFYGCTNLTAVIIRANQVATLANTNVFTNASNAIIYVPDDLVASYKAATNWSTYASRIKGISELPA